MNSEEKKSSDMKFAFKNSVGIIFAITSEGFLFYLVRKETTKCQIIINFVKDFMT